MNHPLDLSLAAARERAGVASVEAVEAARDLAEVISILILEFTNPEDKKRLLSALQLIMDVTLENDLAGSYRVCDSFGEEKEPRA